MSVSIFGSQGPKFISGATTVLLDHWVTQVDTPEEKLLTPESELAADRDFISRGDYWEFSGYIHLFDYGSIAQQKTKFNEIYQFNQTDVVLYKHRDGNAFTDPDGNNLEFFMTVVPANLKNLELKDILYIKFRSKKAVKFVTPA